MEEKAIGTVRVSASALNVRREASTDADVIVQLKRGDTLTLLASGDSWSKVRLPNGDTGWAASRFLQSDSGKPTTVPTARKKSRNGCPADSDYAFTTTPTPTFSDSGAHGLVVIEATVNASGNVTATRVVSNATGDESLAFLAQREIKSAKFSPPIRNCVAKSFIFTYRRTF
ncbi:MAG TPA: TonB family protein [Thermoanaerobaculia bacterium]|nr:TonB family protein [Thermoanaerobaculia bacterium]